MTSDGSRYKKILLKLSGESLAGDAGSGIDPDVVGDWARQIKEVRAAGVSVAIVIGGGNIFRGLKASELGMERATADYMGMLATVLNSLALQDAIEKLGVQTRVMSSLHIQEVSEPYVQRNAVRQLKEGDVVIFAAGTGNPYFTTDTAASLRAIEIGADVLLKATRVDGVYSADPEKDPSAKRYTFLTYKQVLNDSLAVMDSTAVSLCMDNQMPIFVFDATVPGNILRVVSRDSPGSIDSIGTLVAEREP